MVNEHAEYFYINRDGKRYRMTEPVRASWKFARAAVTTEAALSNYPISLTKLPYRDGTLLNNYADGKLYLVSAGRLRLVASPSVLPRLGMKRSDALVVSDSDIKSMKMGTDFN